MGPLISSQVGALVASTYVVLCSTFIEKKKKNLKESQEKKVGFFFCFFKKAEKQIKRRLINKGIDM